jgi:hypothetical protein
MARRKRIGEILIDLQVLTETEVESILLALRRRGGRAKFGHVAKEMGLLRKEHVLAALAVQMELLPRADEMSLSRLLAQLSDPVSVGTPPPGRPAHS